MATPARRIGPYLVAGVVAAALSLAGPANGAPSGVGTVDRAMNATVISETVYVDVKC
ncbi:hypothetical protein [Mycolicibacterium sp. XJ870]